MASHGVTVQWGHCPGCDTNRWLIMDRDNMTWLGCRRTEEAAVAYAERIRR
jgi:hypothetical protein